MREKYNSNELIQNKYINTDENKCNQYNTTQYNSYKEISINMIFIINTMNEFLGTNIPWFCMWHILLLNYPDKCTHFIFMFISI